MSQRARRGWVRAAVALGVLVVAVAAVQVWRTSAAPFPSRDDNVSFEQAPVGVSHLVGIAWDLPQVRVQSVEVRTSRNSPPAATALVLCTPRPGAAAVGAVAEPLDRSCAQVRSVEGLELGDGDDYLVLSVVPLAHGTIQIDSVRLRFAEGWRTGSQLIGPGIRLEVR